MNSLDKARRSLTAAETLLATGAIDDAANRVYFSLFNAARFLITLRTPDFSPRTHAAVLSEFSKLYVLPGHVPRDWGKLINRAQTARHVADYGDEPVAPHEIETYLALAKALVSFAEQQVAAPK